MKLNKPNSLVKTYFDTVTLIKLFNAFSLIRSDFYTYYVPRTYPKGGGGETVEGPPIKFGLGPLQPLGGPLCLRAPIGGPKRGGGGPRREEEGWRLG